MGVPVMTPLTLRVAGAIGSHFPRRYRHGRPVRMCEMGEPGHNVVAVAATDRCRNGSHQCPACAAPIAAERLGWGKVRIPDHERLPSITVRVAAR